MLSSSQEEIVKVSEKLKIGHVSISKWLNTNVPIPLKHAIKIEKLTKGEIKAKELRPDVYEDQITIRYPWPVTEPQNSDYRQVDG